MNDLIYKNSLQKSV